MPALYRTYRPTDFSQVVGQEAVVRTLRNAIEHDQVRQAYLFAGPRGTGKTSMARILAKSLNCAKGPTVEPDNTCHACVSITSGTSLDVIEMDAASQRGIDDIREIRERVILQPAEGRYKVYILDEAHQLTDAAWNALLKLIEEPPPHLVFIFCTTELQDVRATVRSRCQTFLFRRPQLSELGTYLRWLADGEGIKAPDAALALIARSSRGSFRDAGSTLDQLASATDGDVTVQAVLQLSGAIEEESLYRLCDMIIDRDTAGALTTLDALAEQGHDLGGLVDELLEHLRQVLLVQHIGDVPASFPLTEETKERLRGQAKQLPEPTVVRLIDLLGLAVEDKRHGGDPRLPLELAVVKVTRPAADMSRESLAHRVELLEAREAAVPAAATPPPPEVPVEPSRDPASPEATPSAEPPPAAAATSDRTIDLEQLREAWPHSILAAVRERSTPTAALLEEAQPLSLDGDTLTIEFASGAEFHRRQIEEPKNAAVVRDALFEVTGRKLSVATTVADGPRPVERRDEGEWSEEDVLSLLRDSLGATEVDEPAR